MNRLERYQVAESFISSLPTKPLKWYVGGSTQRGDFREDSDIDIFALFEHSKDEPLTFLEDTFPIDFHTYAKDWLVYKYNPQLLEEWGIK